VVTDAVTVAVGAIAVIAAATMCNAVVAT
jgi:hypothetical protein